jgi:hypothetical protein
MRIEITNDTFAGRKFRGIRLFRGRRRLAGIELQIITTRMFLFVMWGNHTCIWKARH